MNNLPNSYDVLIYDYEANPQASGSSETVIASMAHAWQSVQIYDVLIYDLRFTI